MKIVRYLRAFTVYAKKHNQTLLHGFLFSEFSMDPLYACTFTSHRPIKRIVCCTLASRPFESCDSKLWDEAARKASVIFISFDVVHVNWQWCELIEWMNEWPMQTNEKIAKAPVVVAAAAFLHTLTNGHSNSFQLIRVRGRDVCLFDSSDYCLCVCVKHTVFNVQKKEHVSLKIIIFTREKPMTAAICLLLLHLLRI